MSLINDIQYESWDKFALMEGIDLEDLENSSDDETHPESAHSSPMSLSSTTSWNQPRIKVSLNSNDRKIFGTQPAEDVLTLVTCNECGMVLKQQALYDHFIKRHKEATSPVDSDSSDSSDIEEVTQDAKRQKFEVIGNFYVECARNALMESGTSDFGKITVKLKRNSGTWAVVGY